MREDIKRVRKIRNIKYKVQIPVIVGGIIICLISSIISYYGMLRYSITALGSQEIIFYDQYSDGEIVITLPEFDALVKSNEPFELEWLGTEDNAERYKDAPYYMVAYEYNEVSGKFELMDGITPNEYTLLDIPTELYDDLLAGVATSKEAARGWMIFYDWPFVSNAAVRGDGPLRVISLGLDCGEFSKLFLRITVVMLLTLLGVAVLTYLVVRRVLAHTTDRMHAITEYVNDIGKVGLPDEPLVIESMDELQTMSTAINSMVVGLKDRDRIESELKIATSIQANMLPKTFPAFPEYRQIDLYATMDPAKEVGGDLYDFFKVDEKTVAVVIGDVSGKGVPAALFMVIAKTLIKTQAQHQLSPAEVFTSVNNMLCDGNDDMMFVTGWMAMINVETGEMKYACAGHNPPLLTRNGEYQWLNGESSTVLAVREGINYTDNDVQLEPGDRLFIYTDGVTEASNANSDLYGEDRLIEYMNAHRNDKLEFMLAGLRSDIDEFVDGAEQFDDITMLIFEYIGK